MPQYVLLKGPLTLELVGTKLALGAYSDGLSLPATTLRTTRVIDCPARAVITIENATSYHELIGLQMPELLHLFTGAVYYPHLK